MDFINSAFIQSVFIFLCISCVDNKLQKFKTSNLVNSDPNDVHLDSPQFLAKYSYSSERHSVTTEDGYIVNLFRIPRKGPPVLLIHGIGDSSDSWLVLGPNESIAYLLADVGFDVWLYNARGNKYSKGHSRNVSAKQYWNFSYEEMGSQDLPATIDYILYTTSRSKLSYVGFSQGTTIFFVMCSMKPEYNAKINHAILLAPVAWVNNLQYPFIDVLANNLEQLTSLAERLGVYELFANNEVLNAFHSVVCNDSSSAKVLCDIEYYISYGLRDTRSLFSDKLPVIASHIPAGTSTKTFLHFIQGYASKRFQRYSYFEPGKNKLVYGSSRPPEYNVTLVSAPVSVFVSESDWYSSVIDVDNLKRNLPNIINFVVFNKSLEFTHLEFVYGSRVKTLINDPVIRLLEISNK